MTKKGRSDSNDAPRGVVKPAKEELEEEEEAMGEEDVDVWLTWLRSSEFDDDEGSEARASTSSELEPICHFP